MEVKPLNSGVSPARDVREHAECLFYEQIPGHRDPISMSTTARDVALQSCAEAVTAKLREERDAGPTVFPSRDQPFYIETFVPWDFTDGYPCGVAWLIVGLRYFFPEGCGETVKVFSIRSFGFSGEDDFASMGDSPFATIDSNPTVKSWPRHGYIR
ncbi:MAG: hypothetical protein EOO38_02015 [Cytophagaceae bacterium]|nr:MAG: hypothetical protein EOO38_02015 [Cytophagaceae bacterium]